MCMPYLNFRDSDSVSYVEKHLFKYIHIHVFMQYCCFFVFLGYNILTQPCFSMKSSEQYHTLPIHLLPTIAFGSLEGYILKISS